MTISRREEIEQIIDIYVKREINKYGRCFLNVDKLLAADWSKVSDDYIKQLRENPINLNTIEVCEICNEPYDEYFEKYYVIEDGIKHTMCYRCYKEISEKNKNKYTYYKKIDYSSPHEAALAYYFDTETERVEHCKKMVHSSCSCCMLDDGDIISIKNDLVAWCWMGHSNLSPGTLPGFEGIRKRLYGKNWSELKTGTKITNNYRKLHGGIMRRKKGKR